MIESWHTQAVPRRARDRVRGTSAHVVFTAHSLPARILVEGDPYQEQLFETARLVAERAEVGDWTFELPERVADGEPWLGPDILDHLTTCTARRARRARVPVGFVSDHLEIRWDIDVEAQERARELGMTLRRIEMPNADREFVRVLASLVDQELGARAAG